MRKQPIEVHIRLKDPRVIAYYKSLGAIDTSRSKHFEELLKIGLNEVNKIKEEGESKLPGIDMYYTKHILGLRVSEAYKHGIMSSTQVNLTYRGMQEGIGDIEKDEACRECIPSLRDLDTF